ncbi:hypothetical protein NDU88_004143 [Pleurodeles waltl]|uniref:Uncharacterized protein n=1 Tax=Pleurodeles waltl TaxID=8319 RepID=A0AAV7UIG9_PLEWA|nr:hypothetical protein NDU88_004143 [Pleurodeles waltl]
MDSGRRRGPAAPVNITPPIPEASRTWRAPIPKEKAHRKQPGTLPRNSAAKALLGGGLASLEAGDDGPRASLSDCSFVPPTWTPCPPDPHRPPQKAEASDWRGEGARPLQKTRGDGMLAQASIACPFRLLNY